MRSGLRFVLVAFACAAASCRRESDAAPAAAAGDRPPASSAIRATLPDGSTFELPAPPRRVIAGNTAAAEFIAPLLGPERLAALPEQVDQYSSFDFGAHGFEKVRRFARYAAEPLIELHPDLVVTHAWQAAETTDVLRRQGTPVLVLKSATSYEDIRATILVCARIFDLEKKGEEMARELDLRVARLKERARRETSTSAGSSLPRALVYTNDGNGGWAAGSDTTADTLLRLAGLRNAAGEAGIKGHASLDFEKLISIDPDVIVVGAPVRGEGGSATKAVLESTPALAHLRAIRNHGIAVLSGAQLASDSQCLVDGAEELARQVDAMHAGSNAGGVKKP
jgi:iron complex transport system substrate-binding protein